MNGRFDPITYGYNYKLELRIPIFSGFALNLGGSRLKSTGEGTIDFEQTGGTQTETHFLKNDILVYPFKIGFSYMFRLPFFPIYPSASVVEGSLSSASMRPLKDTNLIF